MYGDPSLSGEVWSVVDDRPYLSFIINYSTPVHTGYLNRVQIYSVKLGVNIDIQVWRIVRSAANTTFLLVSSHPYVTRQAGGFENTVCTGTLICSQ